MAAPSEEMTVAVQSAIVGIVTAAVSARAFDKGQYGAVTVDAPLLPEHRPLLNKDLQISGFNVYEYVGRYLIVYWASKPEQSATARFVANGITARLRAKLALEKDMSMRAEKLEVLRAEYAKADHDSKLQKELGHLIKLTEELDEFYRVKSKDMTPGEKRTRADTLAANIIRVEKRIEFLQDPVRRRKATMRVVYGETDDE